MNNADGDALSGWRVVAVRMATYNLSLCQRYTVSSSQPSAAEDPAPLVSELLYSDRRIQARPGACAAVLDENKQDPSFMVYTRQNLDGSTELQDRPLNVRHAPVCVDTTQTATLACASHRSKTHVKLHCCMVESQVMAWSASVSAW